MSSVLRPGVIALGGSRLPMVIVQELLEETDGESPGFAAQFIVRDKIANDYWVHPSGQLPLISSRACCGSSRLASLTTCPPCRPVGRCLGELQMVVQVRLVPVHVDLHGDRRRCWVGAHDRPAAAEHEELSDATFQITLL